MSLDVTPIYSKNGGTQNVVKIGNRNYLDYPFVTNFRQRLADIRVMEVLPDDIFVGGMPKSGNHWVYELVGMVINQTSEISKKMPYDQFPEFIGTTNFAESARSWPSPRIMFYHTRLTSEAPADIVTVKPRIVYLMRNPKDIYVSGFKFFSVMNGSLHFSGTWEDYFELSIAGEFPPDSWFDHVLDAEKFMEENPEVPFHLLVFEKLKEDLEGEIKKLCQFLGKPTDIAKEIAEVGEFEKFKPAMEKAKVRKAQERLFVQNSSGEFFRKGKVGDWKNTFTVAQSEAVDQLFEAKMSESKFARHVKPYM